MAKDHYGIVIDSGSSGSRVQIYSWPDSSELLKDSNTSDSVLRSVPQIRQEKSWTHKITPGISTFGDKPSDAWHDHYEPLIEYAEKIVPKESREDTPIFILATAGMRLLPEKKRNKLLKKICEKVGKHSDFKLDSCSEQIQIIDGETEGLYGWIGLNYLMGQLNDYDSKGERKSYGFMDMGGASTQISFVPNKPSEIERHRDDISTLYLKNNNGDVQQWDIFVSTWLGFGANEARKRHLKNLINMLPEKSNQNDEDDFQTTVLYDPCLPKGATIDFLFDGHSYDFKGSGNYEQCLKLTYPLLLKNLPCTSEPCLFNGVHAPEIDFYKDKFVGISEYWYTANDVFHMGGAYNFEKFNEKVKLFCESDWSKIEENSANGEYNNVPNSLLLDSCFKANWVLNILHEGFNLPRGGIETSLPEDESSEIVTHVPFQSAGAIEGSELSWTLGRILLYASSLIATSSSGDKFQEVGFQPSKNEHKGFIPGGIVHSDASHDKNRDYESLSLFPIFFFFVMAITLIYMVIYRRPTLKKIPGLINHLISKIKAKYHQYQYQKVNQQISSDLENGVYSLQQSVSVPHLPFENESSGRLSPSLAATDDLKSNLRTRSFANLQNTGKTFTAKKPIKSTNSLLDFSTFKTRNDLQRSVSASVVSRE